MARSIQNSRNVHGLSFMGHVGCSGLGTMRGWAHHFWVGGKMLELNLQAISVQRAIDGALEKLLYVQT